MSLKIPNQPPIQKSYERPWLAFTQNKLSGLSIKEEIKTSLTIITPLKTTGVPRTLSHKGKTSFLIITASHQGTCHITTTPNTIHRMHHDGCRTRWSQWISAEQGPLTEDEEEEETLEEEEANTTTNLPTAFKEML